MEYRMERDTMGEIRVPADRLWGAQTARSLDHFPIGEEKFPLSVIRSMALIKAAAARVNREQGKLDPERAIAIEKAAFEIRDGRWEDQFPLSVWQTGSGTHSNMNVNEVISHRSCEILGKNPSERYVHPNDHVNMSQSSNDVVPTAIHIAALLETEQRLRPALRHLREEFERKEREFDTIIKVGRTHLMDAVPLRLGQEFSAFAAILDSADRQIRESMTGLREIALGGTAVGTGMNASPDFAIRIAEALSELTENPFRPAENLFQALSSMDAISFFHGALRTLAAGLMKIANDIRWLGSGPRAGLGELILPAGEPGSSIMPGKVNPTQAEAITMVAARVMGNDTTIQIAASQGNFQLNVYRPVAAHVLLQSIALLSDSMDSFARRCVSGIRPDEKRIRGFLEQSLMPVTALSPVIGYERAAQIAKLAHAEGLTLREAALRTGYVTEGEFDSIMDYRAMTGE